MWQELFNQTKAREFDLRLAEGGLLPVGLSKQQEGQRCSPTSTWTGARNLNSIRNFPVCHPNFSLHVDFILSDQLSSYIGVMVTTDPVHHTWRKELQFWSPTWQWREGLITMKCSKSI